MATKPQGRLFLTAIFIAAIISSSLYASSTPNVKAEESNCRQKALSTLVNVVGFDLSEYDSLSSSSYDLYRDTLPRENIRLKFDSDSSKIDALCTFINGSVQMIEVFNKEGSPRMIVSTASTVEMAQNFLTNYQTQSRNSFYGELGSMLTEVDANKNSTQTVGNLKLQVTASENDVSFIWTYTLNDIEAPDKCIALRYKDGLLKYFVDNWNLYKIGSTNVNLSEKEAIDIAIMQTKNYVPYAASNNATIRDFRYNVTNAMIIETIYSPSLYVNVNKTRSPDLFELYPLRHVWVSLDKFYPGNVYGFNVYLWADTKEVCYFQKRITTMDPPVELVADYTTESTYAQSMDAEVKSNSLSVIWGTFGIAVITLVLVPTLLKRGRKKLAGALAFPKPRFLKIGAVLFCLLLSSLAFASLSATVSASHYWGRATVWGAESVGAWNEDIGSSWRKQYNNEVTDQRWTAEYIADAFTDNGYYGSNYQGDNGLGSGKSAILSQIYSNHIAYSRVIVVDFDHGNGKINTQSAISGAAPDEYHFLFEDNWGTREGSTYNTDPSYANEHAVFDAEIYDRTNGEVYFAFINTCNSANVDDYIGEDYTAQELVEGSRARGMPFAWTHRMVAENPGVNEMSSDGYGDPDSGENCYIGFDMGSAALQQTIGSVGYPYYLWVCHFFDLALSANTTVHEALDIASHDFFGAQYDFDETQLSQGFTSVWPMYMPIPDTYPVEYQWYYSGSGISGTGQMKVFGNADIKLYQTMTSFVSRDSTTGTQIYSPSIYIDNEAVGDYARGVIPKTYGVYATDCYGYHFSHYSYNGGTYYYQNSNIEIADYDGELTAYYTWVPYIYVDSVVGGHTNMDGYNEGSGTAEISAYAYSGYHLDHWNLNGNYLTGNDNPIYVDYNSHYTVTPVFAPDDGEWLDVCVTDYNCPTSQTYEIYDCNVWIDDVWQGYAPFSIYLSTGWHNIEVDPYVWDSSCQAYGWFYAYYDGNDYNYENPASFYIGSDMSIQACFVSELTRLTEPPPEQ
jgi:hypothetical protein